jgi:hypothetical protein
MMPKLQNAKHPIRNLVWISVTGLLLLGGCKKQPENNSASTASGSAPAAGSANSNTATPAQEQPQSSAPAPTAPPSSTPATSSAPTPSAPPPSAPAASSAPPPPPAPSPVVYTIPSNSRVSVRLSETLSTKTNSVGDSFRGTLAASIRVNGVIVFRYGTPVRGTIVGAKGQGRFKGAGDLTIALNRIGSTPVTTTDYEKAVSGKGKRSAGFIGGGGGGGALLGAIAGGGKGALIGGLVGAGAGTAGAAFTGNKAVEIPAEALVSFSLTSPVQVTVTPPASNATP